MNSHYNLNDLEFTDQFQKATLDSKLFTHEAHLRLAWIYINNKGVDIAIEEINKQLVNYVASLNASEKYNKTVTTAAIKAVYHFWLKTESKTFRAFIKEFPRLKNNFKELLASHYGIDIFNSEIAKSTFLEPNLLPFD